MNKTKTPVKNIARPRRARNAVCAPTEISFNDIRRVHPALQAFLGYCLHKVTSIFKSEMNKKFAEHGMQGIHFAILSVIEAGSQNTHQMKICEETGIDKASMVKIIDHLESRAFIERRPSAEDRRVKNLAVTRAGLKFLKDARAARERVESDFLTALNDAEKIQLKNYLVRILDYHRST